MSGRRRKPLTEEVPTSSKSWWGRTPIGTDVMEAARARTAEAFDTFDHVYVSFSGGKDSTAVLNVALDEAVRRDRLPLRVVFWDEEAISLETEAYVRRVAQLPTVALEWYCLPVRHRNACSDTESWWWPWAPEAADRWVRPLPAEAITYLEGFPMDPPDARPSIPAAAAALLTDYRRHGSAGMLMGIRASESLMRLNAVSNKREDNWIIPVRPGFSKVYPIYDWRTEDVWTAPAKYGWDYNTSYDLMEMAGVSRVDQRLAPPFGEEPMHILWMWATCFPDVWERMVDRVPGAPAAARYSRGPLYNFHEHLTKPAGITWQEFIAARINEHPPEIRAVVARKVQRLIRLHHSKTTDPLVGHAPHPRSGYSWERIYAIADKGDLKDRKSAYVNMAMDAESMAKYRAEYDAERAAFGDGRG